MKASDIEISISAPAARKKGLSPLDFNLMRQPLFIVIIQDIHSFLRQEDRDLSDTALLLFF